MKLREKIFIWFIAMVYLMGQWGCSTGSYGYPKPEPLLEKYREQLGAIGVATGPDVPVIEFDTPPPPPQPGVLERMGRGAWEGGEKSLQWWGDNVLVPVVGGGGQGIGFIAVGLTLFILALPVTIFGGLGGFFYGALPPDGPPAYVDGIEAFFRYTLAQYPIQKNLQSSFLKEAHARTSHTFVVVPEEGTPTDESIVGQDVDSLLELSVRSIRLKRVDDREGERNPPMVLVLVVRTKLVRVTEKTVWYDQTFVHETKSRLYEEWPHYHRLQIDIEKAYQKLAEEIVQKLFYQNPTTLPAKIDTSGFVSETHLIAQP